MFVGWTCPQRAFFFRQFRSLFPRYLLPTPFLPDLRLFQLDMWFNLIHSCWFFVAAADGRHTIFATPTFHAAPSMRFPSTLPTGHRPWRTVAAGYPPPLDMPLHLRAARAAWIPLCLLRDYFWFGSCYLLSHRFVFEQRQRFWRGRATFLPYHLLVLPTRHLPPSPGRRFAPYYRRFVSLFVVPCARLAPFQFLPPLPRAV